MISKSKYKIDVYCEMNCILLLTIIGAKKIPQNKLETLAFLEIVLYIQNTLHDSNQYFGSFVNVARIQRNVYSLRWLWGFVIVSVISTSRPPLKQHLMSHMRSTCTGGSLKYSIKHRFFFWLNTIILLILESTPDCSVRLLIYHT